MSSARNYILEGVGMSTARSLDSDRRHLDAFRPIRLQKAADVVIAVIADAIRAGLFAPGDLLPPERSLAAQLQVSRAVLREAIDVLRREGVLSVKRGPGGGIRVVSDGRLREVVASLRGEVHDLMRATLEVRRSLELPAFLLAAKRAGDGELEALKSLVDDLIALADEPEEFYAQDQRFHREVVRLSANPVLADFYRSTLDRLAEIRRMFPVLQVPGAEAIRNQQSLYEALKTRNPHEITCALDEHLSATEIIYLGEPIRDLLPTAPATELHALYATAPGCSPI
jgi:GntR family transcriptional repressor for pyruvate dehydrogenase complex